MTHEERAKALASVIFGTDDTELMTIDQLLNYKALQATLYQVERETWAGLKVTNDQLRWALKELGPTGTNAEAYIKAAVEYLIDVRAKVQP